MDELIISPTSSCSPPSPTSFFYGAPGHPVLEFVSCEVPEQWLVGDDDLDNDPSCQEGAAWAAGASRSAGSELSGKLPSMAERAAKRRGRKPGPRSDGSTISHVEAERQRREKLNRRFCDLRAAVPTVSRMDKASLLADAAAYIGELRGRVERLEGEAKQTAAARKAPSAAAVASHALDLEVKSLKDQYFAELSELYNKISVKLQHVDSMIPPQKPSDQYEKMKSFKMMLERTLQFLQINKNNIQSALREKVPAYERQIISILNSQRRKPVQTQEQQQFQQSAGQTLSCNISQQQQPSQGLPQHDSHTNQMPQASLPNMSTGLQSSSAAGIQHVPAPPATNFGVPTTQQHVANAPLAGSNLEAAQGSNLNSLQHGSMSCALQQGSNGC